MCLASLTLAKLPFPIVLIKRYLPICVSSADGLFRGTTLALGVELPPDVTFPSSACQSHTNAVALNISH